jgi:RNA polymerase sigma-70 factor (ECF subfamily)
MPRFHFLPGIGKKLQRARFERQVEDQLPSLVQVARGLVSQQTDAEDLVHDTCVKALTSFDSTKFSSDFNLRAWLKRILVNTYRDQYRRAQRSPVRPINYHATSDENLNVIELVASTELSPSESMEHRKSSSAIQNAFSTLPPEVRVVSVLFLVNELSYKEIATITESPIGTVMSRLSRGRKLLREQLSDYAPEDRATHVDNIDRSHEG